jgi:hypothetical protein
MGRGFEVKKVRRYSVLLSTIAILAVVLFALGCSDLGDTSTTAPTVAPTTNPGVIDTPTTAPQASGTIDERARLIQIGQTVTSNITAGPYPYGMDFYAVQVPAGTSSVTVTLSGFSGVDLDLYVDSDDSILNTEGDMGTWQSNQFGAGDESVTISNPAGVLYILVNTYDVDTTLSTDYTLSIN